jgi:NAD(P)-dependent dehydrogenase (short-subunit alcohol dehydrogenase family)
MSTQVKSAVITGCSSGFGRVTALHLARHGWRVFATVRRERDQASLLVEAASHNLSGRLTLVRCDITHAAEVQALGQTVAQAVPRLEALINNAGTAYPMPLELLALDELRAQLEVNVVGHLAVTQALLPLLKTGRGTVVNVSSIGGRVVQPVIGSYCMSKFALEAMSDALRLELAPLGVRVAVIESGGSPTAIWETSLQRGRAGLASHSQAAHAYAPLLARIEALSMRAASHGYRPEQFAELVLKILNARRPRVRYAIPARVAWIVALRQLMPDEVWDGVMRRALRW